MAMKITKHSALGIGFFSFLVVALLDTAISPRVSLLLLHLVPVLFVTWFAGPRWGLFFAVAMTASQAITSAWFELEDSDRRYRYLDLGSDFTATVLLVWMQSKLRNTYEQIDHLARHDALTGIVNRNGFYEMLQAEMDRKKRYDHPLTLIYFDCDNFKSVNDAHGHHIGDALLVKVAATLRSALRRVDVPSRLGGDEFLILLPETGSDAARKTVMHLKESLDSAMRSNHWPVTFSIGVATFEQPPANIDHAIEFADLLMYHVKKSGKNSILFRTFFFRGDAGRRHSPGFGRRACSATVGPSVDRTARWSECRRTMRILSPSYRRKFSRSGLRPVRCAVLRRETATRTTMPYPWWKYGIRTTAEAVQLHGGRARYRLP